MPPHKGEEDVDLGRDELLTFKSRGIKKGWNIDVGDIVKVCLPI